jgi:hypothetical protein
MAAGIRIKTLMSRTLAQDLPQPGSTVERMVATCWVTKNVKPLPPQAVAHGQACALGMPSSLGVKVPCAT